jgi:hypothetical protein
MEFGICTRDLAWRLSLRYCLQGLPLKVKVGVRFFSTLADIGAHLQAALLVWS